MRRAVQTFGVWEKTERATQQCEYCKLWFAKVDARHYRTCIFIPGEERRQKLAWLEELKKDRKRVAERERYARKRKLAAQMITPNNTVPQKRGRGRHRKNPVANMSVNSTNTNNVQGGSVPFGSDSSLVHEPGNQLNRTVGSCLNPNLNSKPAPTPYHTPMQHNARYDISSEMPFDEIRDDGSGYECVQDSMDEEQDKEPPLDSGEQQRKIANRLEILATSADRNNQLIESLIESTIQGFEEMKRLVREGQGQSDEIDTDRSLAVSRVPRVGGFTNWQPARTTAHRMTPRANASEGTTESETPTQGSTVFYAGNSYSENEWADAVKQGVVAPAPAEPTEAANQDMSIADVMAFSGPGPEIINGRLAMLAFISAMGAELSSGETVLKQWSDEPTGVFLSFVLFSAASLIPMLNSTKREAFGPFSPEAETLNGRAAMIGFASLLAIEIVKGSALF